MERDFPLGHGQAGTGVLETLRKPPKTPRTLSKDKVYSSPPNLKPDTTEANGSDNKTSDSVD